MERKQNRFQNVHRLRLIETNQSQDGVPILDLVSDLDLTQNFSNNNHPITKYGLNSKNDSRKKTILLDEIPKVRSLKEIEAEKVAKKKVEDEYEIDYYVMEMEIEVFLLFLSSTTS